MGLAITVALLASCAAPAKPNMVVDQTTPVIRGVSYVGISVSDIDKTAEFYETTMNLKEVQRGKLSGMKGLNALAGGKTLSAETRLLRGENGQLRLMQFGSPSPQAKAAGMVPVQGPGVTHVCHQSPDSKPMFPKIVAAGAKPLSRTGDMVQLRPDVPVRYAYLRDRDGVMLEIEQLMQANLPFNYHMRHVAMAVTDIERTVKFYTTFLGGEPRERRFNLVNKTLDTTSDLDNVKLNVAWYQIGNLELEIWQYLNPAPKPAAGPRPLEALGYNMIVLDVSDVDAAAKRLLAAGGTMETRSPFPMDGGRIAFGRDPDGNLIGLLSIPTTSPLSDATLPTK
jgi:catechol 2,3-dioxygenase-like lactoylglutathione lyase family enzyme